MKTKTHRRTDVNSLLTYNDKEGSHILFFNKIPNNDIAYVKTIMKLRQQVYNGTSEKLFGHIIISPNPEDSKFLTFKNWKTLGIDFMQKSNMYDLPAVCYLHMDKNHLHLHFVICRVLSNGKLYSINENELVMAQYISNSIAKEMGLHAYLYSQKATEEQRESIRLIEEDLIWARDEAYYKHGKITEETLNEQLKDKGRHFKKTKVSYCFLKDGSRINQKSLRKDLRLKNLISYDVNNSITKRNMLNDMLTAEQVSLNPKIGFEKETYFNTLSGMGYTINIERKLDPKTNKKGRILGYSITKNEQTINASEISPELSLKKLKARNKVLTERNLEELQMLDSMLCTLTHSQSFDDTLLYFEAIKNLGFKTSYRFKDQEIVGYYIHVGKNPYSDAMISQGRFSLDKVHEHAIVKRKLLLPEGLKVTSHERSVIFLKNLIKSKIHNDLQAEIQQLTEGDKGFSIEGLKETLKSRGLKMEYPSKILKSDFTIKVNEKIHYGSDIDTSGELLPFLRRQFEIENEKRKQEQKKRRKELRNAEAERKSLEKKRLEELESQNNPKKYMLSILEKAKQENIKGRSQLVGFLEKHEIYIENKDFFIDKRTDTLIITFNRETINSREMGIELSQFIGSSKNDPNENRASGLVR